MRFQEILVAAATVALLPYANGTVSVTGDEYCQALTQDGASRCIDDLCTFSNGMDPKYSCCQSVIDEATRIYEDNAAGIRNFARGWFPERYIDFLRYIPIGHGGEGRMIASYIQNHPGKFLKSILNIVLYIPVNIIRDSIFHSFKSFRITPSDF